MLFMKKKLMMALALGVGLMTKAEAQSGKICVQVVSACKDAIGARLVTEFRDAIARSPRYQLDSSGAWGVSFACVSADASNNVSTAADAVFVYNGPQGSGPLRPAR